MDRSLDLLFHDDFFFDTVFDQMDREIARMHHDMRGAMSRLTPRDALSTRDGLDTKLKQVRDVIVAKDGVPHLDLTLDMSAFKPGEIEVKVKDDVLMVVAHHEEEDDHSCVKTDYRRIFNLPKGTDVEAIRPKLSKDGVLSIKGPLPIEGAKTLPIEQPESSAKDDELLTPS